MLNCSENVYLCPIICFRLRGRPLRFLEICRRVYNPSNFSPDKAKCALQIQIKAMIWNIYSTEETSDIRTVIIKASTARKVIFVMHFNNRTLKLMQ